MAAVATADPTGLESRSEFGLESRLECRLAELCGHLNATFAALVDVVAEAAATAAWEVAGIRSLSHWVTWKTGLSSGRARQLIDLAAARLTHPAVSAAFDDGLLSIDQAALAVCCQPIDDAEFAHLARVMTIPQLRLALRASQPSERRPEERTTNESLAMFATDDDHWACHAVLDADRGHTVEAALAEARDRLFRAGDTQVTWADALVDIAQRSLDATPLARRDRFRINVFIDPARDARATWTNGIGLPDMIRDLLLCDGTITPTFLHQGVPVNVGRTQRIVPDRVRRLVEHRDKKCRVPWCQRQRHLTIHHVIHWRDNGPTATWNLIALCEHCHRTHHHGQLGITGNADQPDGILFTDQHGQVIDFAAHPHPPNRPAPTPRRPYRHPLGERMQRSALLFDPQRHRRAEQRHRPPPPPANSDDDHDQPQHAALPPPGRDPA